MDCNKEGYAENIGIKEECSGDFNCHHEEIECVEPSVAVDDTDPQLFTDDQNCDMCEYVGESLLGLREHRKLQHETMCSSCVQSICVPKVQRGQIFKCEGCKQFLERSKRSTLMVKNSLNQIVNNSFACEECDYATSQAYNLIIHKESEHMKPCDKCKYTATTLNLLEYHKKRKHETMRKHGKTYACDQCDYSGSTNYNLKEHKKSVHEGIKYTCDLCEYSSSQVNQLKIHKQCKHGGIRYPCDQCKYSASKKWDLKVHKQSKHEGIRFTCDQCEYSASQKWKLKVHMRSVHECIRNQCSQCIFSTTSTRNLMRHKQRMH